LKLGEDGLIGLAGLVGEEGDWVGEVAILESDDGTAPASIACLRLSLTPFGEKRGADSIVSEEGVDGCEERMAFPSSESASNNSGGSRSFSISDLRLLIKASVSFVA